MNDDNNVELSWDDASQSSEGLGLLFWDDVSIGEGGSTHDSLNSLRGISQTGHGANGNNDAAVSVNGGGINIQGQGILNQNTLQVNQSQRGGGQSTIGNNEHTSSSQLAQAQSGAVRWSEWNWNEGGAANNGLNNNPQPQYLPFGNDDQAGNGSSRFDLHQQQQQQAQSSLASQAQQQQNMSSHVQHQAAPQHAQSQTMNEDPRPVQNLGGMQLNALPSIPANASNALQLQTNSIPPNLPPQAHPFYLWMLQQQAQQQQAQHQLHAQHQAQQAQAQQEAQRIAQQQEQERLKREEEARRQQEEEAKRLQEQVELQKEEEARRQQEVQKQQQAQQQVEANENASAINVLNLPQIGSLNPQQQLALFQYQLAMTQSQQNNNGQITLPQMQLPQGGDNLLMQQQFQFLQTLQQFQPQGQPNVNSTQALTGPASSFQPVQTGQAMLPASQNKHGAIPEPTKLARRSKDKTTNSSPIAPPDCTTEVIGNTIKSLNNTIKSIHSRAENPQALESTKSSGANQQLISGSMKSLNSTLVSTVPLPQQAGAQGGTNPSEVLVGPEKLMKQNLLLQQQQQGTPMVAYNVLQANFQANPPTANPIYPNVKAQGTAPAPSNMNVISSDTDGEALSRKGGKTFDNYATESGTDDDFMLLGARANAIDVNKGRKNSDTHGTNSEAVDKTNKERNREHAKNTRLRKKAYVESLKQTVDELCRERDALVAERANAANLMVETHSKRVDVLRSFFALRAGYSLNQKRELWSSILDESCFTCRLPVTPYQSFPSSEVQLSNCQRTISGVDAMIADVASNAVFLETLVDRYHYPLGKVKFQYTLVTEDSVTEGNQIMARWSMETLNARQCGARIELHQQGMLFCKFNSAHKIVTLDIMFDVMAFMLQVKMAMGFENFNDVAIPNTVQTCQKQYDYPMVMTLADRPYTIVQVNERWENLTGYTGAEVVGKRSCSILQGSDTGRKGLERLMSPLLFKRPSCGMITNYTKNRRRYRSYVTLYPLSTDSNVSHYFGLTTFVQWIDAEETVQSQAQNNSSGDSKTGGNSSSSSQPKRLRDESAGGSSAGSHKSKQAKANGSSSSCSDGTNSNDAASAVKLVTVSNRDKQSLSSLTSSMSSSSTVIKGVDQEDSNSVAVLAPSRTKTEALSANPNSPKHSDS